MFRAVGPLRSVVTLVALIGVPHLAVPESAAQPPTYSAVEIRGWVVDSETKQPLEGVYVVAQWILQTGVLEGRHVTRLHIMETRTDTKGEYNFPAWGPKVRPFMSVLDTFDPDVVFFKPGYQLLGRGNQVPHHDPVRTWRWNGETLEMKRFSGTDQEWALLLDGFQTSLSWGQTVDGNPTRINDNWRQMPSVVLAVWRLRETVSERWRFLVRDLQAWQVTEADLLKRLEEKGATP